MSLDGTTRQIELGPITGDWLGRYASAAGDDNPLHGPGGADGLQLVQGNLLACLIEDYIERYWPEARVYELAVRFLRPVPVGSIVVMALRPGGTVVKAGQGMLRMRATIRVAGALSVIADGLLVEANG